MRLLVMKLFLSLEDIQKAIARHRKDRGFLFISAYCFAFFKKETALSNLSEAESSIYLFLRR